MRRILLLTLIITSLNAHAQEGVQLGVEVSPSWNVNIQRQKTTGLRSYDGCYGFNIGVPLKWWFSEYMAVQTGVTFEYMAFDSRIDNTLFYSLRFGSVHVPLMFNYKLSGNWNAIFGGGVNLNVFNQEWNFGITNDISGNINGFQPYAGIGIGTLVDRENSVFELGARGRFHFLSIYNQNAPSANDFTNRVLSFDLILRMFLFNR